MELKVQRVRLAHAARRVRAANKDSRGLEASAASRASRVSKVFGAIPGLRVSMALQGQRAIPVSPVCRGLRGATAQMD